LTEKLYVPELLDVPLIVPLLARVNPGGSCPDAKLQLYGNVPPLAVKVLEYVLPTVPEDNEVVTIDKVEEPDVIEIENGLDAD
jgi:hypothetical protein